MENKKEKDVIIFASTDKSVVNDIKAFAEARNKHLVQLDDKVIMDYLKGIEKAKDSSEKVSISEFLNNSKNKDEAETKAMALYNLITHNGDILSAEFRVFKKSDITKKTNLTHKTLGELLTLFSLFGLIEWKKGDYEFSFVFSEDIRRQSALADITNTTTMLNQNIVRYITQFPDEDKKRVLSEVCAEVRKAIIE